MAIYRVTDQGLLPLNRTTFAAARLSERQHLQQFLKQQIEVIAPDTLVISEEFGDWDDSRRRIDLLGIDRDANLVVIELKRTEDGGHMELQAVRYAAMVSAMTFNNAISVFGEYLERVGSGDDPRSKLLELLEWDEPDDDRFAQDVRIVLASAEFSKEITTSVLWLNERGIDIRCIRMHPYHEGNQVLLDIQQVIPLPEAEEYQVKIRDKARLERVARTQGRDFTRFDVTVRGQVFGSLPKRRAILHVIKGLCDGGLNPEDIAAEIDWKGELFRSALGRIQSAEFAQHLLDTLRAEGRKPETGRFFIAEGELIYANGKTYALTKMWGVQTAEAINRLLEKFPDQGVSYSESDLR